MNALFINFLHSPKDLYSQCMMMIAKGGDRGGFGHTSPTSFLPSLQILRNTASWGVSEYCANSLFSQDIILKNPTSPGQPPSAAFLFVCLFVCLFVYFLLLAHLFANLHGAPPCRERGEQFKGRSLVYEDIWFPKKKLESGPGS